MIVLLYHNLVGRIEYKILALQKSLQNFFLQHSYSLILSMAPLVMSETRHPKYRIKNKKNRPTGIRARVHLCTRLGCSSLDKVGLITNMAAYPMTLRNVFYESTKE